MENDNFFVACGDGSITSFPLSRVITFNIRETEKQTTDENGKIKYEKDGYLLTVHLEGQIEIEVDLKEDIEEFLNAQSQGRARLETFFGSTDGRDDKSLQRANARKKK